MRQGFDEFTRQQDSPRAEAVAATLAEFYRQQGSWDIIRYYPQLWTNILSMDIPTGHTADTDGDAPSLENQNPETHPNTSFDSEHSGIPRTLRSHWSLVDKHGLVVAGNTHPAKEAQRFSIVIGGEYVGELVVSAHQRHISAGEQHFLEQQWRSSALIMGLSAIAALLTALLLARRFLAPIRQLAQGTHTLADGDYQIQLPITRRDELGQLAEDFNALARTLDNNEKLRRNFMADISHELRTPLAILKGEIEAMTDGVRKVTPDALESLYHEVSSLTRLVDDLYQLALSDVGGLRYRMQDLDLVHAVSLSVQAMQERFKEHGLSLNVRLPPYAIMIHADRERLTQLVNNLLENSIRYTDKGGVAQLTLSADSQHAHLILEDSEPGVLPEDLPRLFERLYRVEESRNRATGGAGLGLPLCQTIVIAHQGTLTADASALGGLKIKVELPRLNPL